MHVSDILDFINWIEYHAICMEEFGCGERQILYDFTVSAIVRQIFAFCSLLVRFLFASCSLLVSDCFVLAFSLLSVRFLFDFC
jgi:hypothetical protein